MLINTVFGRYSMDETVEKCPRNICREKWNEGFVWKTGIGSSASSWGTLHGCCQHDSEHTSLPVATEPNAGLFLFTLEVSRSHARTHHTH
jgi:hypothetical protein